MNPRVIFIGAGPVGLMTAIQIKLYDPAISILMLEKYAEYQRKHPLLLNHDSFADTHPDPHFQKFIQSLPDKIKTNELEDKLLTYAKKLGIVIENTKVDKVDDLIVKYKNTGIIIGSDGSHSIVHEQVFDHQYQIKKTLQYIAEIKYEAEGKTRALNKVAASSAVSAADHLMSEFVGQPKDGKTPVAIRIFINKTTYDKMQDATFKNPYSLDKLADSSEPELQALYKSIQVQVKARENNENETRITGSERITVTHLPVYASSHFTKHYKDVNFFLVGDAAFGVPYFRSLNNGILCSSQLAKTINCVVNDKKIEKISSMPSKLSHLSTGDDELAPMSYYANYVQHLVNSENFVAEAKNFGVKTAQTAVRAMHGVRDTGMKLSSSSAPLFSPSSSRVDDDGEAPKHCVIL